MNRGRKRKNSYGGGGHMMMSPPQTGGGGNNNNNNRGPPMMSSMSSDAKRMRRTSDASLQGGRREPGGGRRSPVMLRPPSDGAGGGGPMNVPPEWKRGSGALPPNAEPMMPQAPTFNDPLYIAAQKAAWDDHQNGRGIYASDSYAAGAAPLEQYLTEKVTIRAPSATSAA